MDITIVPLLKSHWADVKQIYAEGINTGNATFETKVSSWDRWDQAHLSSCRFIAQTSQSIAGWAALSPVSGRLIYRGIAEVSVYVSPCFMGQGIGPILLNQLTLTSEKEGIWTLQAAVFPENEASIRLHKKMGFRIVGVRENIGRMNHT